MTWGWISLARSKPASSEIIGVLVTPPGTKTFTVTPVPSRSFAIIALSASNAALEDRSLESLLLCQGSSHIHDPAPLAHHFGDRDIRQRRLGNSIRLVGTLLLHLLRPHHLQLRRGSALSKPELKQFGNLAPADFLANPVWIASHTADYVEAWYEETDEETFRPWTGALPVSPSEGMLLVRATLELRDGSHHSGFVTPAFKDEDLGALQPHIFVGGCQPTPGTGPFSTLRTGPPGQAVLPRDSDGAACPGSA
jgi:hypothetical protein